MLFEGYMRTPKRFSYLNPESPQPRPSSQDIHFVKEGHHYLVRYGTGQELAVVCSILSNAMDDRLNLNLEDAKDILRSLGMSVSQM